MSKQAELRVMLPAHLHRVFQEIARSRNLTMQALAVEIVEHYTSTKLTEAQALVLAAESIGQPLPKPQLYVIRRGGDGPLKIGVTRDIGQRVAALQSGCAEPIRVLAVVEQVGDLTERALHKRFAEHRQSGEWFAAAPELLAFAEELASRNGRTPT